MVRRRRRHNARMDRHACQQYLRDLCPEYLVAARREKSRLLDEAERRTGWNRKVLIRKLCPPARLADRPRRQRPVRYDLAVKTALAELWAAFDFPCGQRLVPILREQIPRLCARGLLHFSNELVAQLVQVSPSTADRLLAGERSRLRLNRYRRSTAQRLLLESIPVKLPDEWDRSQIGNLQIDYVLHCGPTASGHFLRTFSAVDIASGWWQGWPVLDGTEQQACDALDLIRQHLPFRIREIHPDNDSAFLNYLLQGYCQRLQIALSRSRPLKKNDNCWVEEKNWTHVRKLVGYHRFAGHQQYVLLCRLYELWTDWKNFFQPVMRLREKTRQHGRIHRRYDQPRTPYQRLLASGQLSSAAAESLKRRYESLNPFTLLRAIADLVQQLEHSLRKEPGNRTSSLSRSVTGFMTQRVPVRLPG